MKGTRAALAVALALMAANSVEARPYPGARDAWAARRAAAGFSVSAEADDVQRIVLSSRRNRTNVIDNDTEIDVNNIAMFVTNTGSFAWNREAPGTPAGLEFPKGSGQTAVFAAGLWMGALVGGQVRIALAEYDDEYGPGAVIGSGAGATFDDATKPEYKVYKLNRVYSDSTVRNDVLADYNAGAVPHGAPVVTVLSDGTLSIPGDQMLWAVYNDLDPERHGNGAGSTLPLGVEVQQTTFAFSAQGALGNTIFLRYKIFNRGANQLDDMYVSQWSDPDLGDAADDLVGSDFSRSLGFVYNATNSDGAYGSNVPSVGYDFFQGPRVAGSPLGLASFNKYINGTDPNTAQKTYNYMKGLDADGNPVIDPTTGAQTFYQVPGDPVTGTGWLDSSPADRRLMLSSGPFSMAPGDSQEVVVGLVIGQSSNRLASIALMKFLDNEAQSAFDVLFDVPPAPDPPAVIATPTENGVLLTWDDHAEDYAGPGYVFEGYAIYQGRSAAGSDDNWVHVATYDIENGITTVLDDRFDDESFVALPKVVARGTDIGIRYSLLITQDAVRGGPLVNAFPYYFTVRSYAVNPSLVPRVKESADTVRTVIPQTPTAGTLLDVAGVRVPVSYGQYNASLPATTDSIQVVIVDRSQVIAADYKVGYKPDPLTGLPLWYVVRTVGTDVDTVVNDQSNYAADGHIPIVDGIQIKIVGAPYRQLLDVFYTNVGPNPQAYGGYPGDNNLHLGFFDGSADYFANIGSLLGGFAPLLQPDSIEVFNNVEIRFTGGAPGQKAYRYMGTNSSPRYYLYQDYVDVPFTAWDIDNNRQLNVGINEMEVTPPNGMWDPDTGDADPFARREFVVVFASTYSATPLPFYTTQYDTLNVNSNRLDTIYLLWTRQETALGARIDGDVGDKITFQLASRSANDYFTFSTRPAERGNVAAAQAELARVRAVPNPYYMHSRYELNQFNRQVKFTHLPQRCTIRIFNLAGDLVRTIEKNDATSLASWDLLTNRQLPVGSGIYIFHVDAQGIGTQTGKVAIFMEKERLNVY